MCNKVLGGKQLALLLIVITSMGVERGEKKRREREAAAATSAAKEGKGREGRLTYPLSEYLSFCNP